MHKTNLVRDLRWDAAHVALCTMLACGSAFAAPVTHFSSASINSASSVRDTDPDSAFDANGALLELSSSGSQTYAYSTGTPNRFAFKPTTDDAFARVSLSTAELKARSYAAFGTDGFGSFAVPVGRSNAGASAEVSFGDSFRAYSGNTGSPFAWSSGDTATFNFSITGTSSHSPGLAVPTGFDPGQPQNRALSTLQLSAFRPGGLDLRRQLNTFDFSAYPSFSDGYAVFLALDQQLTALTITRKFWYLGEQLVDFPVDPAMVVTLTGNTPVNLSASFNPEGDFDWVLELNTSARVDASLQNVFSRVDFANTVEVGYEAPQGATTYSASGQFPGTLSLTSVPAVPEPQTWGLMMLGLAAIFVVSARRREAAVS